MDLVKQSVASRSERSAMPLRSTSRVSVPCSIVLPIDNAPPEVVLATLRAISTSSAPELYEVLIVDCASRQETKEILSLLGGDVKIMAGSPEWSYAKACEEAAKGAGGK